MKLIDAHVHVGPFFDNYYSPLFVHQLMSSMKISQYAISSTSTCEENYSAVISEIKEIIKLDGDKILPTLWITPNMIDNRMYMLNEDINWRCLKIHPGLHPNCWDLKGKYSPKVLELSREFQIPILIHTGDEIECNPNTFLELINYNFDVNFILAHGRPLQQAINALERCPNVYLDSAFMPVNQMVQCINLGYSERLLWGTDMCIPGYYYNVNLKKYYVKKIKSFRNQVDGYSFERVTYHNAKSLFG
ncbi:MAG: amidohydrolase family protein [Muribaculaceae bacterium]|nr:amidohydrolase family protein [Muribaculaceae bacterium]